jgi:hypothetical protein
MSVSGSLCRLLGAATGLLLAASARSQRVAACCTIATSTLDTAQVTLWRADLEYLRREMPNQHANLFHAMTRPQFDSAFSAIRAELPHLTRYGVIVELMRLDALVGDGHSSVSPWRDTVVKFHTLPITLYRFDDGYHIRAVRTSARDLLGARVLRIGSFAIDSAEKVVAPLISHDNSMALWQYSPLLLAMPEVLAATHIVSDPNAVPVTVEQNGHERTLTLHPVELFPNFSGDQDHEWDPRPNWIDARSLASPALWLSHLDSTYWFRYLPASGILYCQLNEIQQRGEPFDRFFQRALAAADSNHARRFVLDLRLNGGGNGDNNRVIVRSFIKSRFDAPHTLFVVTSRRTFSAAEMLIADLSAWTNPVFVGEPAASRGNHYGDSKRIVLPKSGITVRVASLYWQYWDPRDKRPWQPVDLEAPLTWRDYVENRDPAIRAIESLEASGRER